MPGGRYKNLSAWPTFETEAKPKKGTFFQFLKVKKKFQKNEMI